MKKSIYKYLNKNESLLKHGMIILIASMIVNVCNYVFQLYMGRTLGPIEYGILGALFSIIYIITFSFSSIQTIISKFTSEYKAKNEYGKIFNLFTKTIKKIILFGLILFIGFIIFSNFIADFLKIPSTTPIILVGLFLCFSFLSPVITGILNGLQKFKWQGIVNIINAFFKLLFGILLVSLGFGVVGAVLSLSIGVILTIALSLIPLSFLFKYRKQLINHIKLFKYSLPIFIATVSMVMLVNFDVILVKHFFNAVEAGYYTAASVLAKIIFFGSSALVMVMFPKVSNLHTKNKNTSPLLKTSLFYTFLISFLGVMLYLVAPTFIVNLLYGAEYKITNFIGWFAIALGFYSLSNVLVMYNLAIKKIKFAFYLFLCLILEIVSIILFHGMLLDVIKILVIVNIVLFIGLLIYTKRELGFNGVKL